MLELLRPTTLPNIFPQVPMLVERIMFGFQPGVLYGGEAWKECLDLIIENRLSGLALGRVRRAGHPVDGAIARSLRAAEFADISATVSMAQASLEFLDALERAEIPFLIMKGPGLAVVYANLAERPFSDLDVLVPEHCFRQAMGILRDTGLKEAERDVPPWDGFYRRCQEGINLRGPSGASIDLHHHVAPWLWGERVSFEFLSQNSTTTNYSGLRLRTPCPEANALVVALHIVSDQARPGRTLRAWSDLIALLRVCDTHGVSEMTEACGLADWFDWILECLPEHVDVSRLPYGARRRGGLVAPRRLRGLVAYSAPDDSLVWHFCRVPALNAAYHTVGTLFPSRSYLVRRYPGVQRPRFRWAHDVVSRHFHKRFGSRASKSRRDSVPGVAIVGPDTTGRAPGGMASISRALAEEVELRGIGRTRLISNFAEGSRWARWYEPVRGLGEMLSVAGDIDIVHLQVATGLSIPRELAYAVLWRALGRKVVSQFHGAGQELDYAQGSLPLKFSYHLLWRLSSRVLVLGSTSYKWMSAMVPSEKLVVVPNFVDTGRVTVSPVTSSSPTVAFVGRIGQRKGAYDLLEAVADLRKSVPDVRVLFLGDGETETLRARAVERGVDDSVEILGWCDEETRVRLVQEAWVVALPSYEEGLPMALLEAMAAGRPIVASDVGDISDLVGCGDGGFTVHPGDTAALGSRLREILEDRVRAEGLGRRARVRVESRYDTNVVLGVIGRVYRGNG